MKKTTIIILILAVILIAGCSQQQTLPLKDKNTDNKEINNCESFCKSQPHIMCTGYWNISGKYPDCSCGFVCD